MTEHPIDLFFLNLPEPQRSCMFSLREVIKRFDSAIEERWKYRMPMYAHDGKDFCHLWIDKETNYPYICFKNGRDIEDPRLVQGDRKRMKFFAVNPAKDLPMNDIQELIEAGIKTVSPDFNA